MAKSAAILFINSFQTHTAEIAIRNSTSNTEFQNFWAFAPKNFRQYENSRDEVVSTGKYNIFNDHSESTFNFQIQPLYIEKIQFENLSTIKIDQNISTISSAPPADLSVENRHMTLACATTSILSTNSAAEESYAE